MSDNTSVIDAVRLLAKATKDDSARLSDIVKGVEGKLQQSFR